MAGIMKLGTGKTRVRQAKDSDGLPVPREMTVTPSKPPGKVSTLQQHHDLAHDLRAFRPQGCTCLGGRA